MTGIRRVTTNLGPVGRAPPEAIVERHAPRRLRTLPHEQREMVTELAHWSYGALGGALFGRLPPRLRARPWAGPAYGLTIWLVFELGLAPVLGVQYAEENRLLGRVVIALDHAFYGFVVAGRLAPVQEALPEKGRSHS
ncbi:MAG: hypothetical protein GEV03_26605 [Streptosporangiales bacterium]|nr:hypothetical protein [Streptosporangiales bacterium]